MRNRYPGGSPKYLTTSGLRSRRCCVCKGEKKFGSVDRSLPPQIYHPFVSPAGGCRSPLIGVWSPVSTANPTLECSGAGVKLAPYCSQVAICSTSVGSPIFFHPFRI